MPPHRSTSVPWWTWQSKVGAMFASCCCNGLDRLCCLSPQVVCLQSECRAGVWFTAAASPDLLVQMPKDTNGRDYWHTVSA